MKAKRAGIPWLPIAIGGVALIALGVGLAWAPMQRSSLLSALDASREPAQAASADAAADAFLAYVGSDSPYLRQAVIAGRGPLAAQIRLAEKARQADLLVMIAERPQLTATERVATLDAAARIWPEGGRSGLRLPGALVSWIEAADAPLPLVRSGLALLLRANDASAPEIAYRLGGSADAERAKVGIEVLAGALTSQNAGFAMRLLDGRNAGLAVASPAFTEALRRSATSAQLAVLIKLLGHEQEPIRALALSCLGGPAMTLASGPTAAARRADLGAQLGARLAAAPPTELPPLVQAISHLRLTGASTALFADLPRIAAAVPAADAAKLFGEALVFSEPEAREETGRHLDRLLAALDRPSDRALAAAAFALVKDTAFPQLRDALERLAKAGDEASLKALAGIVGTNFGRPELAKATDAATWQKTLAADRAKVDRLRAIAAWLKENDKFFLISDGKAKLTECRTYVTAASREIDGWLQDPQFTPPIGYLKKHIEEVGYRLHLQLKMVNQAWSGAM